MAGTVDPARLSFLYLAAGFLTPSTAAAGPGGPAEAAAPLVSVLNYPPSAVAEGRVSHRRHNRRITGPLCEEHDCFSAAGGLEVRPAEVREQRDRRAPCAQFGSYVDAVGLRALSGFSVRGTITARSPQILAMSRRRRGFRLCP